MGKGAYIRIQNESSHEIVVELEDARMVELNGLESVGVIASGSHYPTNETDGNEDKYGSGGLYLYIEGKKNLAFQKDGHFNLKFKTTQDEDEDSSPPSITRLCANAGSWWQDEDTQHLGHQSSSLLVTTAIDEIDDHYKAEIRVYDTFQTSCWMSDLEDCIRETPLCRVGLPGTHDSGTYRFEKDLGASPDSDLTMTIQDKAGTGFLGDAILAQVFDRLCQTQDKTIKEQLELGVRYLDLRIALHNESGKFYTCHGVFCADLEEIIKDIDDFLTANPKEIVLLDFNHLHGDLHNNHDDLENHKKLCDIVLDTLGSKIAMKHQLKPDSPVHEFWDHGAQAIVLYCGSIMCSTQGYVQKMWGQNLIASPWPNSGEADELHTKLRESVENRNQDHFFVLQGILTPDGDLIKREIFQSSGVSMSLKTISDRVSCKVVDWVEDEWMEMPHNVIIVDFFEYSSVVAAIINWNRRSK